MLDELFKIKIINAHFRILNISLLSIVLYYIFSFNVLLEMNLPMKKFLLLLGYYILWFFLVDFQ